ncbi:MAG: hypothetical protein VR75_11455 [Hyphomonadaceae bacterium BRH_c29]|nr:MAG: hypothetical protein VR75_11455 [Hyphomonadaceae bacterium BRH_c29]
MLTATLALPLLPNTFGETSLPFATRLAKAARQQIGVTRSYDAAYVRLDYPMGDIDRASGVCTDVVIRAYRDAFDVDLQKLVHEDMKAAFSSYPTIWGLTRPDKNIDHRRVPNLERYFERHSGALMLPPSLDGWQPGDLYTMRLGGRLPHIGIVSDRLTDAGHPYVIHNIGGGTQEEDILGLYDDERRYRFEVA